jgi:hypothetical protein
MGIDGWVVSAWPGEAGRGARRARVVPGGCWVVVIDAAATGVGPSGEVQVTSMTARRLSSMVRNWPCQGHRLGR